MPKFIFEGEDENATMYQVDWDRARAIIAERRPVQAAITINGRPGGLLIYDEGAFVNGVELAEKDFHCSSPIRLSMRMGGDGDEESSINCWMPYIESDEEKRARVEHVRQQKSMLSAVNEHGADSVGALVEAIFGALTEADHSPQTLH